MTSQASIQALEESVPLPSPDIESLDLSVLPPVFVSLTHCSKEEAESLEERLVSHGANISYDPTEIQIVISRVERRRRAELDLRSQGLWTEAIGATEPSTQLKDNDDSATEDELEPDQLKLDTQAVVERLNTPTVKVIKASWVDQCLSAHHLLPVDEAIIYEGRRIPKPDPSSPQKRKRTSTPGPTSNPSTILARAHLDAQTTSSTPRSGIRRFGDSSRPLFSAPYSASASTQRPPLLTETTSEHEDDPADMPPAPTWIEQNLHYACQRRTPSSGPNEGFLAELKDIRTARLLTGDEIGVRAYSTSIASIASYPYPLRSAREVLRLPGCEAKLARLFGEFSSTGRVAAAQAAREDAELKILRLFYDIWGVGATTAREFYYARGWREMDDVVEFGWGGLSRVQQIGVKYYEEFLDPIPRAEVEGIAGRIHAHAVKVRDARVQTLLVGGYRRGKQASGDVDLLVSHPEEKATKGLVTDIVESLEEEGCITHTLLLALTASNRDQQTLPFKAKEARGGGFDTLDKALVVWQDPSWSSKVADLQKDKAAKNPAPHRRVDIIISPWRTVGCAVAGWSGGTTFQRDLRRYAKNELGWKFDSSGVRDRGSGMVVDVEGYYSGVDGEGADDGRGVVDLSKWKGRATTMEEAERRVFEAMGLDFIEPWDRCTG